MQSDVTGLIEEHGRIVGVQATTPTGPLEIRARPCRRRGRPAFDGPPLRRAGNYRSGAPIDVLWMRISRRADDPKNLFGRFGRGYVFVMLDRDDYCNGAHVIPKEASTKFASAAWIAFRQAIARIAPFLATARKSCAIGRHPAVDRRGRSAADVVSAGLLCIGDAAMRCRRLGGRHQSGHSRRGGGGEHFGRPVARRHREHGDLGKLQRRRMFPTRLTQWLQVQIQNRVITRVLGSGEALKLPWPLKLLRRFPILRRIPPG